MLNIPQALMDELSLRDARHGNLLGQVGLTVNLYYAQDMTELQPVFRAAQDLYQAFIPPGSINFYCSGEEWRPYKPRSLNRLLNRFNNAEERGHWLDFARIDTIVEEDGETYAVDEVGPYGLGLYGRNKANGGSFRETCVSAIRCEFPHDELLRCGVSSFIDFVERLAALAPFDSGHVGFSFKWNIRTDEKQERAWIRFKAPRFLAIFPYLSDWELYTRHHLACVNWLTLLGTDLSEKLGGADGMCDRLGETVEVKSLAYGTLLMAGETPPLGDVNQQAPDLGPLREVARLTRPYWLNEEKMKNRVLNYLWHEPEDREAWINRFERTV